MSSKLLEYTKTILSKVSFDSRLFEKELIKAIRDFSKEEIDQLKQWCFSRFGTSHQFVLQKVFYKKGGPYV